MPAWWDRKDMPSVEERVAYLEGRIGDHVGAITDICTDIRALRGEINGLRDEMHGGFESGRGEMRGEVNGLRGEMQAGFASLREEMDRRFTAMDSKISRLMGIQVGTLLMIASAALAYFFK